MEHQFSEIFDNWEYSPDCSFENEIFDPSLNLSKEFSNKEFEGLKLKEDSYKKKDDRGLELVDELGDMGPTQIAFNKNISTSQPNNINIQNSENKQTLIQPSFAWKVESSLVGINMEKRNECEKIFTFNIPSLETPNKRELLTNKDIIEKIISYLDQFNERKRSKSEMAELRKKFSQEVNIPKKTIDDYIMNLKWAVRLNFPFQNYLNKGFGSVRKFVKYNLGDCKKSILKKKFEEDGNNNITLKTLPRLLENIIL